MKTVKDYLELGLVFVGDDMINSVTTEPSYGSVSLVDCLFECGEYPSGIKLVGSMCGMGEWIPSSFAWRNNDGVKPEYKGLINVCFEGGTVSHNESAIDFEWSLDDENYIAKWRPVVLQSESPTASPKEDKTMNQSREPKAIFSTEGAIFGDRLREVMEDYEVSGLDMSAITGKPMKPVYTAEMHAKGELPPVGSDFNIDGWNGASCTMTAIGRDNILFIYNKIEYVREIKDIPIKPIIKTIKVNGFDVPAPMSEAPDYGSIYFKAEISNVSEKFCDRYCCGGTLAGNVWLKRGIIHSNESAAIAHAKAMLGIDPNA